MDDYTSQQVLDLVDFVAELEARHTLWDPNTPRLMIEELRGRFPDLAEEEHVFERERFRHPSARVARKQLYGIAARVFRDNQRIVNATFDRSMETDSRTFHFFISLPRAHAACFRQESY